MTEIEFWHRIKLPDGTYTPGKCNHGPDGGDWPTTRFGMPKDLTGKSVIDVGCWDGFFSFEAEKRNAKRVLATDTDIKPGFDYCYKRLSSKIDVSILDINKKITEPMGFDLVLCYGVLYHLKNPLFAIENLANLTAPGGTCLLETAVSRAYQETPILEYNPNTENDPTNFFYPNDRFVMQAAIESGFSKASKICDYANRATYRLEKQ